MAEAAPRRRGTTRVVMSACGVLCSSCAAYHGAAKGVQYQRQAASGWKRIYHLDEKPENLDCSGCSAPDEEVFHSSVRCAARRCCRSKGLASCAACEAAEGCAALEKAQSQWDGVPGLAAKLSRADFVAYAEPYCGHRQRLAEARRAVRRQPD